MRAEILSDRRDYRERYFPRHVRVRYAICIRDARRYIPCRNFLRLKYPRMPGACLLILSLTSFVTFTARQTVIRAQSKINLSCRAEKRPGSVFHLCCEKVSSPERYDARRRENAGKFIKCFYQTLHGAPPCKAQRTSTPFPPSVQSAFHTTYHYREVSCKIHSILISIEFLRFLTHTLIRSSRKLSPE